MVGVVQTVVPVANDIILGEFKCYKNYGLPSQTLIGATRDGCKVDIERVIKEISYDGAYGPTLDSNGIPLVRYERLIGRFTINNLYLKYFNKKKIATAESDEAFEAGDWSNNGGAYAAETSIILDGEQSAKLTGDTEGYGIHRVFSEDLDLTEFNNGEVSGDSDYIGYGIYISSQDKTDMGATAALRLAFHCDAEETETNYFHVSKAAADLVGGRWNIFKILKSSFTSQGSPDWGAVKGVALTIEGASPSAEVVCYLDCIELIQNQSNSSIVDINGGSFEYTDETTYRELKPTLEIASDNYLNNVTLVGQKLDGKKVKMVLKNCLNDGNISLSLEEKDEVVNETIFTGHYTKNSPVTSPIELYEYIA